MREMALKENIISVLGRIRSAAMAAGRNPEEITLVAVSKTVPVHVVEEACKAGLAVFGENRIQEAAGKMEAMKSTPARWHFIGHLQTNKARAALKLGFELIHSVDSERLFLELEKQAGLLNINKKQNVLLEVKLSHEPSKHGMGPGELFNLLEKSSVATHINIAGLMTMPPWSADREAARPYFSKLRELRDEAIGRGFTGCSALSMGMSGDFETAIEEGATLVRVGDSIFGGRKNKETETVKND